MELGTLRRRIARELEELTCSRLAENGDDSGAGVVSHQAVVGSILIARLRPNAITRRIGTPTSIGARTP